MHHSNGAFEADQVDSTGIGKMRHQQQELQPAKIGSTTDFANFRAYSSSRRDTMVREASSKEAESTSGSAGGGSGGGSGVKRCLRRFGSIMLSHLGTLLIVLLYTVMGGFLFSYLESNNEIESCKTAEGKYVAELLHAVDQIYAQAQNPNFTEAKLSILSALANFSADVFTLNVNPKVNCTTYYQEELPNWNFVNAAYFSVTIITTIGYGHISPMTQWGQIVCMVYGILGIPLMLLFLSKIGEPTAMMFRHFYLNIFCCKCFVKKQPGEGKPDAGGENNNTAWAAAMEEGQGEKKPPPKMEVVEVVEEDEEEEDEDNDPVNIPITVTMMLLTIYVLLGAAVFKIWEKWTMVEGAYFSFITLSTVGFGDYVPGRDGPFNSSAVITELIVGSIYCVFGLAMLSMCINLIQDEISAKFHWIGSKLGISKSSGDEEAEDGDEETDSDEDSEEEEEEEEEDAIDGKHHRSVESRA